MVEVAVGGMYIRCKLVKINYNKSSAQNDVIGKELSNAPCLELRLKYFWEKGSPID
jgi:hypothetical protein